MEIDRYSARTKYKRANFALCVSSGGGREKGGGNVDGMIFISWLFHISYEFLDISFIELNIFIFVKNLTTIFVVSFKIYHLSRGAHRKLLLHLKIVSASNQSSKFRAA